MTDRTDTLLGGPGQSGVDLLLSFQSVLGQVFGDHYNFVSFDPRGVNNSGLSLDCFSGNAEARSAFGRLHSSGTTNVSSTSFEKQYYSSSIYGEWCNNAVEKGKSPYGYYVTTPAVARDLLTFIEAQAKGAGQPPSKAKLWCYGVSYGTVIGSTFASMFPDRVERMILDGVLNAEQYYDNNWRDNVDRMDETMEKFSSFCHSAGPSNCPFWGPTPDNITARMDSIIYDLQSHPVPISGVQDGGLPTMATYSDLKAALLDAIYNPVANFPLMANILHQFERGNVSGLVGYFASYANSTSNDRLAIQCADSYRTNKLTTIEEFKSYVEYTVSKSKYIGDIYPIYQDSILCRSFRPQLPDSMSVHGMQSLLFFFFFLSFFFFFYGKRPVPRVLLFSYFSIRPTPPSTTGFGARRDLTPRVSSFVGECLWSSHILIRLGRISPGDCWMFWASLRGLWLDFSCVLKTEHGAGSQVAGNSILYSLHCHD